MMPLLDADDLLCLLEELASTYSLRLDFHDLVEVLKTEILYSRNKIFPGSFSTLSMKFEQFSSVHNDDTNIGFDDHQILSEAEIDSTYYGS